MQAVPLFFLKVDTVRKYAAFAGQSVVVIDIQVVFTVRIELFYPLNFCFVFIKVSVNPGVRILVAQPLSEAYKVMQLQKTCLTAFEAFYLATLGGAHSLGLDNCIGNFAAGKEADFVVLEPTATPLQQLRYDNSRTLAEKLFVMIALGDDRTIYRTYIDGRLVYERT